MDIYQCTTRAFDGCACKPGQCKSAAVPLQRFTKPRPQACDTTPFQYAAVVMFAGIALLYGATHGINEQQRIDREQQEVTASWAK